MINQERSKTKIVIRFVLEYVDMGKKKIKLKGIGRRFLSMSQCMISGIFHFSFDYVCVSEYIYQINIHIKNKIYKLRTDNNVFYVLYTILNNPHE